MVDYVDDATENILFCVMTPDGAEVLVPASEDLVEGIDPEKREIRVSLPDGLLDLA